MHPPHFVWLTLSITTRMKKFNSQEDALSYFSALPYDTLLKAQHENHRHIPDQMGIYCWFLREEGFEVLSRKLPVQFRPPRQTMKVGDAYLVYYGQVGTNKDAKAVKTADNLQFYFQSNLPHKILDDTLENYSLLPCFRKTIGGLLYDDLMHEQEAIKDFFREYLLIHSLGYEATDTQEAEEASRATKADFMTIRRALNSFWETNRVLSDMNRKDTFIYDIYAPELRYIIEKCRMEAEATTLVNICTKYQLDGEGAEELVTLSEVILHPRGEK